MTCNSLDVRDVSSSLLDVQFWSAVQPVSEHDLQETIPVGVRLRWNQSESRTNEPQSDRSLLTFSRFALPTTTSSSLALVMATLNLNNQCHGPSPICLSFESNLPLGFIVEAHIGPLVLWQEAWV